MPQCDIHLLGSLKGFDTLYRSDGLSADEERELKVFSLGDAATDAARERLKTTPTMAGRPLKSGRFAIQRMLQSSRRDDEGRPTVEVISLVLSASDYRNFVRCLPGLKSLAPWDRAREAVQRKASVSIEIPPSDPGRPDAAVEIAFDLWMAASRGRALGLLPDTASDSIFRMLALLDPADLPNCRWGVGVLSPQVAAEIITPAAGANMNSSRTILRARRGGGDWHMPQEMGTCHTKIATAAALPATASLVPIRVAPPEPLQIDWGPSQPAPPSRMMQKARGRSGWGPRRWGGIAAVLVGATALAAAFLFTGKRPGEGKLVPPSKQSGPPPIVIEPLKPDGGGQVGVSQDDQGSQSKDGEAAGDQPSPSTVAWGGGVQIKAPGQIDGLPDAGSGSGQGGTTNQDPVKTPEAKPDPSPPQDPVVNKPKDTDGDGVPDDSDNCPKNRNEDQKDIDGDKSGDVCDEDRDGDGVPNSTDNCPDTGPAEQDDKDNDGTGDVCDETPLPPDIETGDGGPATNEPPKPSPPPAGKPLSSRIEFEREKGEYVANRLNELAKQLKDFPKDPAKRAERDKAEAIHAAASESIHALAAAIRLVCREMDDDYAARQRLVNAKTTGLPGLTPQAALQRFTELEADTKATRERLKTVCLKILRSAQSLANLGLGTIRLEEHGDAIKSSDLNEATRALYEKWSVVSEKSRQPEPPTVVLADEVGTKFKELGIWLGKVAATLEK
jgi:hypothetical protein